MPLLQIIIIPHSTYPGGMESWVVSQLVSKAIDNLELPGSILDVITNLRRMAPTFGTKMQGTIRPILSKKLGTSLRKFRKGVFEEVEPPKSSA